MRALGNAGGTGSLTSVSGRITGLGKTITASDDQGGSEQLTGLIETNAAVQPGDSGGPLFNKAGHVVGMTTAASAHGFGFREVAATDAYAIPIAKALTIAKAIAAGKSSVRSMSARPRSSGSRFSPTARAACCCRCRVERGRGERRHRER